MMTDKDGKELKSLFGALAKLQLDKVEEGLKKFKLSLPGSFEFTGQLATAIRTVVMDRNIDEADALVKHLKANGPYITSALKSLTVKEMRERCRKSGTSVDIWTWISIRLGMCAKILEVWEKVETVIKLAKSIDKLVKLKDVPESTDDYIKKARNQMKNMEISHEKMSALLDVMQTFNELSPPCISEYLEATIGAFEKSEKIMNTCKKHSEKILNLLREIDRLEEARNNPNSKYRWDQIIGDNPNYFDER